MKELGVHDRSSFPLPELSMQDTYRKTRTRKRAMGDSRKMDGRIFGNVTKGSTLRKGEGSLERQMAEFVGTQITRKKAHGKQTTTYLLRELMAGTSCLEKEDTRCV